MVTSRSLLSLVLLLALCCCIQPAVGQVLYNVSSDICCDGGVLARPLNSSGYRCCGGDLISPADGVCCSGRLVHYPSKDSEYFNWGCCGKDTLFNFRSQLCCEGKVHETEERTSKGCCGKEVVDVRTSLCCDGHLHQDVNHNSQLGCCGKDMYNFTTHLCCTVYDRHTKTSLFKINPLPKEDRDKPSTICCKLDTFDWRTQVCCADGPVSIPGNVSMNRMGGCCGKTPLLEPEKELCCGGQLLQRASMDQLCCGEKLFHVGREVCCGGKTYPSGDKVACCWDSDQIFDPNTHICCHGKVEPIPALWLRFSRPQRQVLQCCQ